MYSNIDTLAKLCPNDQEFGREVRKHELQNDCKFMLKILKQYPNDQDLGKYLRSQLWKKN